MKLFTQNKPQDKNDKEKEIQFMLNIYSVLSRDTSMNKELKQKIWIGALIYTKLTAKEVEEEIKNNITPQ